MPYLDRPDAKVFFDDVGAGEPIITLHGFIENGSYWSRPGVSGALAAAGYRIIDMDMRGHGRSVPDGTQSSYTVESVAADIGALADQLDLKRFHLLTHATGGMAGLRFAMDHSERLLSLTSSDTSAATIPMDKYCGPEWDDRPVPPDPEATSVADYNVKLLESHRDFHDMVMRLRQNIASHQLSPFLNRFDFNSDPERCWQQVEEIFAVNNPRLCAEFARQFYADHDPRTAGLKRIECPNLVLVGEHDYFMRQPAEQIARCVPQGELVVLEGLGHMIAIEDPGQVISLVLKFLRSL
jgi:pimeloyl-ACP methyl ester carboxylesterase